MNGLKCAETDVESNFAEFATFRFEFVENFRREVEAGRGGGDGAGPPRVDGLVTLAVGSFIGTVDVRRKRDVAEMLQVFFDGKRVMRREADGANSQFSAGKNFGLGF